MKEMNMGGFTDLQIYGVTDFKNVHFVVGEDVHHGRSAGLNAAAG